MSALVPIPCRGCGKSLRVHPSLLQPGESAEYQLCLGCARKGWQQSSTTQPRELAEGWNAEAVCPNCETTGMKTLGSKGHCPGCGWEGRQQEWSRPKEER